MKYLYGFDISMERTGITVFDIENLTPVTVTSIQTNKKHTHGMRLNAIVECTQNIIELYPPVKVAIERGFTRYNTSTQVIYRAHGVINYLMRNCDQKYYPPKQVKEAIIKGTATKKDVQKSINVMFPSVEFKNEDESDSFAVALTYLIENKLIAWNKNKIRQVLKTKIKDKKS